MSDLQTILAHVADKLRRGEALSAGAGRAAGANGVFAADPKWEHDPDDCPCRPCQEDEGPPLKA